MNAARIDGVVSVIGVLAEGGGLDPIKVLMKGLRLQGIFVGSRQTFEDMNRAIRGNRLKPAIARTFSFAEAPEALKYLESGSHFGKVVIKF